MVGDVIAAPFCCQARGDSTEKAGGFLGVIPILGSCFVRVRPKDPNWTRGTLPSLFFKGHQKRRPSFDFLRGYLDILRHTFEGL